MIDPRQGPVSVSIFGRNVPLRLLRGLFVVYAIALHTSTHVPHLEIPIHPFSWFDKVLHFTAFTGWTVLFLACSFFGAVVSIRNLRFAFVLGLIVAGVDESTQALRWVNRDASWGDFAADSLGVAMAVCMGEIFRRRFGAKALLADLG